MFSETAVRTEVAYRQERARHDWGSGRAGADLRSASGLHRTSRASIEADRQSESVTTSRRWWWAV